MNIVKSRKQINMEICGGIRSKIYPDGASAEAAVLKVYPNVYREGSAGGHHWIDRTTRKIVAASCIVERPPHGRVWLSLRPKT